MNHNTDRVDACHTVSSKVQIAKLVMSLIDGRFLLDVLRFNLIPTASVTLTTTVLSTRESSKSARSINPCLFFDKRCIVRSRARIYISTRHNWQSELRSAYLVLFTVSSAFPMGATYRVRRHDLQAPGVGPSRKIGPFCAKMCEIVFGTTYSQGGFIGLMHGRKVQRLHGVAMRAMRNRQRAFPPHVSARSLPSRPRLDLVRLLRR